MLIGVLHSDVEKVWHIVGPMIQRAIEKGQQDELLEDVKKDLVNREAQLWVYEEGGEILAAGVTRILVRPQRKVCALSYVGGSGLQGIIDLDKE